MTGTIPSTLGNLLPLTTLDLSNNQFTGTIPTTLGNLVLSDLHLSNNQLTDDKSGSRHNSVWWLVKGTGQGTGQGTGRGNMYCMTLSKLRFWNVGKLNCGSESTFVDHQPSIAQLQMRGNDGLDTKPTTLRQCVSSSFSYSLSIDVVRHERYTPRCDRLPLVWWTVRHSIELKTPQNVACTKSS